MSGRSDHDLLSSHGLISQYKQELGLPEPEAQAGHAQGSVALDWRQHVVGDDQRLSQRTNSVFRSPRSAVVRNEHA